MIFFFSCLLLFLLWLVSMHACVFVCPCMCFFFESFMCFVSYELDLVPCLIFGGHLKILNFKFVNHQVGYLGICLI